MNKVIEVEPNINEDEPVFCPICKSIINRIWNEEKLGKLVVFIACEKGHVLEVSEVNE